MDNDEEALAVNVIIEAMGAPVMNIADNAGLLGALVREKVTRIVTSLASCPGAVSIANRVVYPLRATSRRALRWRCGRTTTVVAMLEISTAASARTSRPVSHHEAEATSCSMLVRTPGM